MGSSSSNDDDDGNDGDTIRNSIQRATPTPSTNDNDSRNTADLATPIEETPRNTPRSFRITDNEFQNTYNSSRRNKRKGLSCVSSSTTTPSKKSKAGSSRLRG